SDRLPHGRRDGPVQWRQYSPGARRYRRSARRCSSAPVSVELCLVTALREPAADVSGHPRSWVPPVLFQDQSQLLANEFRPRQATFFRCTSEENIHLRFEGDGCWLLSCKCHESNITQPHLNHKPSGQSRCYRAQPPSPTLVAPRRLSLQSNLTGESTRRKTQDAFP